MRSLRTKLKLIWRVLRGEGVIYRAYVQRPVGGLEPEPPARRLTIDESAVGFHERLPVMYSRIPERVVREMLDDAGLLRV